MHILFAVTTVIFLVSCSSTPKGQYSRSEIDRAYALPDDIATTSFGIVTQTAEAHNFSSDVSDNTDDESVVSLPSIIFEQGISENINWVYPLGLRYGIYDQGKHTVGLSAMTLFLVSAYELQYRYRLNEEISLRPYHRGYNLDLILVNEEKRSFGAEVLYQPTQNFSLSFGLGKGTYVGETPLLEDIFEDLTGAKELDSKLEGTYSETMIKVQYSISEKWDVSYLVRLEKLELDDFDVDIGVGQFYFTYIY